MLKLIFTHFATLNKINALKIRLNFKIQSIDKLDFLFDQVFNSKENVFQHIS